MLCILYDVFSEINYYYYYREYTWTVSFRSADINHHAAIPEDT